MDKIFIDTDVLLDHLLDRKPFSDHSSLLLSLGELKQIKLYSSVLVFANCYYILRKYASHQKVIHSLTSLSGIIDFIDMGRNEVVEALHSSFGDFEDALQNAAATKGGIVRLVTRNIKDYRSSELSVITPEEYLATRR